MAALNLSGKTSGYIKLTAPDVASNATVELPNKDGILATLDDVGSGGGGGGTVADGCIYLNNQAITSDYTFPAGKNGMSAGPIDVGATVEVGDGTWTIVGEGSEGGGSTLESLGIPNHDKVTVDENGNVGIGTDTPETGLHVKSAKSNGTYNNSFVVESPVDNYPAITFKGTSGDLFAIRAEDNGSFTFNNVTNGFAERMKIDADGNVMIGTKTKATFDTALNIFSPSTKNAGLHLRTDTSGRQSQIIFGNSESDFCGAIETANGSCQLQGFTTRASDVYFSDDEENPRQGKSLKETLADRDKLIDKLVAKVEALEEKLKKVK